MCDIDEPLVSEVREFVRENRAEATNKQYTHHQALYIEWCKERGIDTKQGNKNALAAYLSNAWKEGKITSASAANTARSAVSDLYRYMQEGEQTLGESKIVRDVISTIEKKSKPQREAKPLLKQHFMEIFPHINLSEYTEVRDYYCMLLMYAMGRRGKEMTDLETDKVVNEREEKRMRVRHEPAKQKNRKEIETVITHATEKSAMNVGLWHEVYMKLREKRREKGETDKCPYYFQTVEGKKMSTNTIRWGMKKLFKKANLPFEGIGTHSARKGAATAMAEEGVSTAMIDQHCTWAGETRNRYIRPSVMAKGQATKHLNK